MDEKSKIQLRAHVAEVVKEWRPLASGEADLVRRIMGSPSEWGDGMKQGEKWDRLADAVRQRRVALGLRQADMEGAGGPSYATVRNVEQSQRTKYAPRTFIQLERALSWPAGTIERILLGGPPPEIAGSRPLAALDQPPLAAGLPDALDQLAEALVGIARALRASSAPSAPSPDIIAALARIDT